MSVMKTRSAWISALALAAAAGLAGCATSQEELLPTRPGVTMAGIWRQTTGGARTERGRSRLIEARARRRRPPQPTPAAGRGGATRTAVKSTQRRFPRLPNPDLTLYIFAHLSGGAGEQVPVPGYTTVFPLYARPYYAQPGERSEYQGVAANGGSAR